jgi:hypothetical protein
MLQEFKEFVAQWIKTNLTPLPQDSDCSVQTWLAASPYPLWRKKELLEIYENEDCTLDPNVIKHHSYFDPFKASASAHRDVRMSSFMKRETYPKYKYPRAINARCDKFKLRTGPIFKLIEKQVFQHPSFIKSVPNLERPKVILEDLFQEYAHVMGTDYQSFEALFELEIFDACEFQLYKYMTMLLPDNEFYELVESVLGGINCCRFKEFKVYCQATRMSGEMCTSLGNGFTNLMIILFVAFKKQLKSLKTKVEGDDGLCTYYGVKLNEKPFEQLGLRIEIIYFDSLTEASFCGIVSDIDELAAIGDIVKTLLDFGWTDSIYRNSSDKILLELLRCKALSVLYQYPNCPILRELGLYGCRITDGYHYKHSYLSDNYKKISNMENQVPIHLFKEITITTRLLVEKRFNISLSQQLAFEKYLTKLNVLQPLILGELAYLCHADAKHYFDNYSSWDFNNEYCIGEGLPQQKNVYGKKQSYTSGLKDTKSKERGSVKKTTSPKGSYKQKQQK